MVFEIDGSLYPDEPVPCLLGSLADRVDYLARLCGAWDFGILPDMDAVDEVRRPEWREAVDATRLLTSPSYHLLRRWHALPEVPYLGDRLARILEDRSLDHI
jgi:hypothetical protein